MVEEGHRQVSHHFGDRSQKGDSHSVDQQSFPHPIAGGNDSGGVIADNLTLGKLVFVAFAREH